MKLALETKLRMITHPTQIYKLTTNSKKNTNSS